jgi:D-glycero-D-manno-heptose 1,7-bisphosphate phosphatase
MAHDNVRPAVFLDRDGVLNRAIVVDGKPHPPNSVDDLAILPGVPESCSRLRELGCALIVVTNQPDIARAGQQAATVEAINVALRTKVGVDAVYVCPHDDADRCECRKPAPGLLLQAAQDHRLDLTASFMVGDRWRDIEAGRRAGCRTIWIDQGYREQAAADPDAVVANLTEATNWIESMYAMTADGAGTPSVAGGAGWAWSRKRGTDMQGRN